MKLNSILRVSAPSKRLPSLLCVAALVMASSAAHAEFGPFPNHSNSKWDGPYDLPITPAAAANMPDGRVVTWSAERKNDYQGDKGATAISIFNPDNGSVTDSSVENTDHDMFCPGTAQLADGTFMITGGNNAGTTTFFDPEDNTWYGGRPMNITRGYHSMTTLHDGSVFTIGGSWSGGKDGKIAEVWDPLGGWRLLSNVDDKPLRTADPEGVYRSDNHMWLFEAPNEKVFHAGPSKGMFWVNTDGLGSTSSAGNRGNDDDAMNGTALMYSIGKIFTAGGAKDYAKNGTASKRAYSIDINGDNASVSQSADMAFARTFVSSAVLPSGEVVVVGGATKAKIFSDATAVYEAEIWNPETEEFTTLAKMDVPRTYHSFALLLRDGRVLVGGGGLCGTCSVNHPDVEILTPPYLLNSNGTAASRPTFTGGVPSQVDPGDEMSIKMNSSGDHSFALVRLGAATHSINLDQRRIPLDVESKSGSTFNVSIPSNPAVVPPGRYWLFAINGSGVPTVGETVHVGEGAGSIGSLPADSIGEAALRTWHGKWLQAEGNVGTVDGRGSSLGTNTIFSAIHIDDDTIALRTFAGLYVSALDDGSVVANRTVIKDWEKFVIEPSSHGGIMLRTHHGRYLSARDNGNITTVSAANPRQWETFTMVTIGHDAKVSLESHHGTFITGGGGDVSAGSYKSASVFTLGDVRFGKISLKTSDGKWVRAQRNYSVDAGATKLQDWEKFDIRRNLDGTVSLRSHHGFYVSVEPTGNVIADRTEVQKWEKFRLKVVE